MARGQELAAVVNDEPLWLQVARRHIGVAEIPGKESAPIITRWLKELGAWWTDDATPWCGVFVAACLSDVGLPKPKHWYRARAYLDYGTALTMPVMGAIVVFERTGGGHVGFTVGRNERGALMVLGGNQGDRVSIAAFDPSRVLGYRWPIGAPYSSRPLDRYAGTYRLSVNES